METKKYLDYEGLVTLSNCLKNIINSDKLDVLGALSDLASSVGDGKLTISINNVKAIEFTANLSNSGEINISIPTSLNDFNDAVDIIKNIIKYGLSDVSNLSDEEKDTLHNLTAENSGFVSEGLLENTLANYGTIINYDSATLKIQLKNGNTVLSEFSAADFIKDSMILDISITDGTGDNAGKKVLLIDFNTDSGITDIEIPISDIFDSDNYYTKTAADEKFATIEDLEEDERVTATALNDLNDRLDDLATVATSGSYTDLTNKPDIPTVPTNVSSFTNDAGYLTQHLDITGKADKDTDAVAGNIAKFDANGNPVDAGVALTNVAQKATTLAGYGITDVYTKTEIDTIITDNELVVSSALNDLNAAITPLAAHTADTSMHVTQALLDRIAYLENKVIYNGHQYVEIGGIKWATMNVGANSVTDTGLYFEWGNPQGYSADQIGCEEGKKCFDESFGDYKWGKTFTKYNDEDGLTTLQATDDAVTVAWGGNWRMPTTVEFQALGTATTSAWTADYEGSGVAGLVLTSNADSSKKLFFPACGYAENGSVGSVGSNGIYWSSSIGSYYVGRAYNFSFSDSYVYWGSSGSRYFGYPVRGVVS